MEYTWCVCREEAINNFGNYKLAFYFFYFLFEWLNYTKIYLTVLLMLADLFDVSVAYFYFLKSFGFVVGSWVWCAVGSRHVVCLYLNVISYSKLLNCRVLPIMTLMVFNIIYTCSILKRATKYQLKVMAEGYSSVLSRNMFHSNTFEIEGREKKNPCLPLKTKKNSNL